MSLTNTYIRIIIILRGDGMEKQGTIYKIENIVNGKLYIGQTVGKPARRFQLHKSRLKRNKHENPYLQNAWNKYGEEDFVFSVIGIYSWVELDSIEVSFIKQYKELNICYNLESGGHFQKTLHESTKKKLSERTKSLGWVGGNHPRSRKVICIDTGEIFDTVMQTSQFLGVPYDNIHQVCCGNNICASGKDGKYYQFAFYEEDKEYVLKEIKNLKNPKKVRCVNTGEIFNSTREAAKKMNVNQSKISLCCNGKRKYTGRLPDGTKIKWEFC